MGQYTSKDREEKNFDQVLLLNKIQRDNLTKCKLGLVKLLNVIDDNISRGHENRAKLLRDKKLIDSRMKHILSQIENFNSLINNLSTSKSNQEYLHLLNKNNAVLNKLNSKLDFNEILSQTNEELFNNYILSNQLSSSFSEFNIEDDVEFANELNALESELKSSEEFTSAYSEEGHSLQNNLDINKLKIKKNLNENKIGLPNIPLNDLVDTQNKQHQHEQEHRPRIPIAEEF